MNLNVNNPNAPFALRVTDPVAWLERNDRDPELHETVMFLLSHERLPEAVLLLENYIGATAAIRSQVWGWGPVWRTAVQQLIGDRQMWSVTRVLDQLMTTASSPNQDRQL